MDSYWHNIYHKNDKHAEGKVKLLVEYLFQISKIKLQHKLLNALNTQHFFNDYIDLLNIILTENTLSKNSNTTVQTVDLFLKKDIFQGIIQNLKNRLSN